MEILKLTPKNYKIILKRTILAIKQGKIIVCPTDTVYGLLANAQDKKAVNNIFKIKKRPKNKPLPIFVKDLKMAKELAYIDKNQEKFLKKVWPGKVTAVLKLKTQKSPKESKLPTGQAKAKTTTQKLKVYGIDKKIIALRIPNYGLLLSLAKQFNCPLIGTSANISGEKPSTKIGKVLNQFKKQEDLPDLVLDAGNLENAKPSTVIDLRQKKIKVIRQGNIKLKDLRI